MNYPTAQAEASNFNGCCLKSGLACSPSACTFGRFPPCGSATVQGLPVDRLIHRTWDLSGPILSILHLSSFVLILRLEVRGFTAQYG